MRDWPGRRSPLPGMGTWSRSMLGTIGRPTRCGADELTSWSPITKRITLAAVLPLIIVADPAVRRRRLLRAEPLRRGWIRRRDMTQRSSERVGPPQKPNFRQIWR
jgi:hypothetical protein